MHFTYKDSHTGEDLEQGDLLERSEGLEAVIGKYHPYYLKCDYSHFLVLTQSCDLVKRDGGQPKAAYVSLAAVRPLSLVLEREAEKYRSHEIMRVANVVERGKKELLREFVRKLLNNNHPEFFYMHAEPQIGLERSCAFLRLTVSIRCLEHYDVCRNARLIGLENEFQAKLGWLVGNLYSRVGTNDWAPDYYSHEKWSQIVDAIVDDSYFFVEDAKVKQVKKDSKGKELTNRDEARAFIEGIKVPSRREQAITAVIEALTSENLLDYKNKERARKHLMNTAALSTYFKS